MCVGVCIGFDAADVRNKTAGMSVDACVLACVHACEQILYRHVYRDIHMHRHVDRKRAYTSNGNAGKARRMQTARRGNGPKAIQSEMRVRTGSVARDPVVHGR